MNPTVGVVVPAYRPVVDTLSTYVAALNDRLDPETIRIELDDATPETVDALQDCPATVNAVPDRRGKGAAITDGFEALETDVLAFADADGSTPASSVARVVEVVEDGAAELSVGSRRHPDATVRTHQSHARRRLGDGFAWIARRLLDVSLHDYQCGAKAIDADAWAALREHLREPGFGWDVELVALASALEYRIAEEPVTWEDDPRSTVSPVGTSVELFRALASARHRSRRLRGDRFHTAIADRRSRFGGGPRPLIDDAYDSRDD